MTGRGFFGRGGGFGRSAGGIRIIRGSLVFTEFPHDFLLLLFQLRVQVYVFHGGFGGGRAGVLMQC